MLLHCRETPVTIIQVCIIVLYEFNVLVKLLSNFVFFDTALFSRIAVCFYFSLSLMLLEILCGPGLRCYLRSVCNADLAKFFDFILSSFYLLYFLKSCIFLCGRKAILWQVHNMMQWLHA